MTNELLVSLHHPDCADPALTGGKGASLGRMAAAGLPVPAGFVVTARAYEAFLAGFDPSIRLASVDARDAAALHEAATALRDEIRRRPLPEALTAAWRPHLSGLVTAGPVAVRSSSTLEDLAGGAFAGQHDTYLGVRGLAETEERIRDCFASLWEDRAVRYRVERGFGHAARMAVVVQEMVDAEAAGVAFCLDPVSGDLDVIVVNGAWGLGETVVAGEGDVDQWRLEKATGRVVAETLGDKTHRLVLSIGGTRREEVTTERRTAPCVSEGELAALASLCRKVESFFAFPQDVEWAVREGRVLLLQSRPVTRFPERWTRDESAERFPAPVTPLTWDFVVPGFHESLRHSLRLMGHPPFEGRWFERFSGWVYGNATAVRLFTRFHLTDFSDFDGLRALASEARSRFPWVQQLPVEWARDLDAYLMSLGRLAALPFEELSVEELWDAVLEIDAVGRAYFLPNIAISLTHAMLHRGLFHIVASVSPAEAPALYDALTGFCETKTSVVNRDLYTLHRLAEADAPLRRRIVELDRQETWASGALEAHPEFLSAFRKFLVDHGHREVEFDAYVPTWSGQPAVVLENLRLMLLRGGVGSPDERENALRERQTSAERRFLDLVPEDLRFFVAEVLRLARAYTALDDLEHYQTTRLNPPFRRAIAALGDRLAKDGVLPRGDDIFFLRKETLGRLVHRDISSAAALEEARALREEYLAARASSPRWTLGEEDRPPAPGALRGLPGSPGLAEANAVVVTSAADFGRVPAGSVLVTRTTNPAWTPLFYAAAAVVTESGGPLSHGAVTAREVGIPAVMGVKGILTAVRDGVRLRVNGTEGTVEILDDPGDSAGPMVNDPQKQPRL